MWGIMVFVKINLTKSFHLRSRLAILIEYSLQVNGYLPSKMPFYYEYEI